MGERRIKGVAEHGDSTYSNTPNISRLGNVEPMHSYLSLPDANAIVSICSMY